MNEISNPFEGPCNELFAKLNMLYGLLIHLQNQLDGFRNLIVQQLDRSGFDASALTVGSALVIRDLTEWPKDNWARYYPTGSFVTGGHEYLEVADTLISRQSAWAVSQGYEAFETFLKDILAIHLHGQPANADQKALKKNSSRLKKSGLGPSDVEYWRMFVRLAYRSGPEVLEFLRRLVPEIERGEQHNNRAINLSDWFRVVSEVRHATTHSNLVIKSAQARDLSRTQRELLEQSFPGRLLANGYQVDVTPPAAETAFKLFAEYGFLVLKSLSIARGYDCTGFLRATKESG